MRRSRIARRGVLLPKGRVLRVPRHTPDVLLLSLRKVEELVAYCAQYEFEDVISSVVDAEMAAPEKLDGVEFSSCKKAPVGMVAGQMYESVTCELPAGHHSCSANMPFGLSVYGYYNVGSYAFVGGSDVKIINPIL